MAPMALDSANMSHSYGIEACRFLPAYTAQTSTTDGVGYGPSSGLPLKHSNINKNYPFKMEYGQ